MRLYPLPIIPVGNSHKEWKDIDWIIHAISEETKQIELRAVAYPYKVMLGKDHIYSYMSDPQRPLDGLEYGILKLHVTLVIDGANIKLRPNRTY